MQEIFVLLSLGKQFRISIKYIREKANELRFPKLS